MPDTLKPCPFCGSPASPSDMRSGMFSCGKADGLCPGTAISANPAAWNRRAPSPEVERLVAENKALKKKADRRKQKYDFVMRLKSEVNRLEALMRESYKHLDYALAYGPEDAIDNALHAGCRDRALAHLRTLAAYKEAQRHD